jgi:hypothetical protein
LIGGGGPPKQTLYVSPTGLSINSGAYNSPVDLETALSGNNRIIYLKAGIYSMDTAVVINPSNVVSNVLGERAIVTRSDGLPPTLQIYSGANLSNIWFGGTRDTEDSGRFIDFMDGNATVTGCTFFGYANGMVGHIEENDLVKQNRFVNCGLGGLIHDIYVSGPPSDSSHGSTIQENIHVGGQGYKIQLYHEPKWIKVLGNFMSNSSCGDLAIQQGDDVISNNILWGNVVYSYWNAINCTFHRNIMGPHRIPFTDVSSNNTADSNVFCNGQTVFGTNPHTWTDADILTNLGASKTAIDTAISNLISKFGQTTAQILADSTIESDFAVLKGVVDAWNAS